MKKLVSILIPAYNAERWIGETLRSAINQTWSPKEVIVVDDGSTDHTASIVKEFQTKLVKVISQENAGASAARNAALACSQGDYIQWLDSDDLLMPDKIAVQMKHAQKTNSDEILFSSAVGHFYYKPNRAKFLPNSLWQDHKPLQWILTRFNGNLNVWMQPGAWLISRKLSDLAGKWDERLSLDDDGEYSCRLVASSEMVKFVSEAAIFYRVGNFSSLGRTLSDRALISYFLSLCLCMRHLLALENSETTRSACLHFLQRRLFLFYPDKRDILESAQELVISLGGHPYAPGGEWGWKFTIANQIMGWRNAKTLKEFMWRAELSAKRSVDFLLHLLSKKQLEFDGRYSELQKQRMKKQRCHQQCGMRE